MRPTRLFRTTALRLSLLYALLFSLLSAAALGFMYWSTGHYIDAQIRTGLDSEAHGLLRAYERGGPAALRGALQRRLANIAHTGRHYLYVPGDGRAPLGDLRRWPADVVPDHRVHNRWVDASLLPARDSDDADYLPVLALRLPDGGRLLIAQSMKDAEDMRDYVFATVIVTLGVTVVIALLLGVLMGRSVLRRIDAVNATAGEIMGGDLSRRLPVGRRGDEFDELALRLNAMLERIEQLLVAMREVTDNVAHDLRSPLNRLRNRLEVILLEPRSEAEYRQTMEQTIADADQLLKTFNALLDIAQAEAGVQREECAALDLTALARDMGELYEAVADEAGLSLRVVLPGDGPLTVRADRHLLAQAIGNLLENAIAHVPRGGHVSLELTRREDAVVLAVADDGPGIPAEARERVLSRFVRLDPVRNARGNGLGLSLVRAAALFHGAELRLSDNPREADADGHSNRGPGLRVELVFKPS